MVDSTTGLGPASVELFSQAEPGRKGEILAAAVEVFDENGYEGGSMRAIASRVGVSEPALYRHFSGKEAIFVALMRVGASKIRVDTFAMVDDLDPQHIREQLLAILRDRRQALQLYGPLIRIILPVIARSDSLLAEYRTLMVTPARAKIMEKAEQIDSILGIPNADQTREARVRALLALLVGYMVTSAVIGDEPSSAIVDSALRVMGWDDRPGD